jgi:transcription-repair coupling factor (superfamily II helicase)
MTSSILITDPAQLPNKPGESLRLGAAYGCSPALIIAELAAHVAHCKLILTTDVTEAESLLSQIGFFSGGSGNVLLFPDLETLPYDSFSPHQDLIAQRLRILRDLNQSRQLTILAAAGTLLPRLSPRDYLASRSIALKVDQTLDQKDFCRQLENAGYQRVSQVTTHGDYALRGSLVDLFPTGHDAPVRVDFFDDQIDSLRVFDPDSQISTSKVESMDTLPAREMPVDTDAIKAFRNRYRQRFEGNPATSLIYREVSAGRLPGGIENYLPLFFESTATLWDYLPDDTLIVCTGDTRHALEQAWQQTQERFEQHRDDPEQPALNPEELFIPPQEHLRQIAAHPCLHLQRHEIPEENLDDRTRNLNVKAPPTLLISRHEEEPTRRLKEFISGHRGRILFATESAGRREMLAETLRSDRLTAPVTATWNSFVQGDGPLSLAIAPLEQGVSLPDAGITLISEQELFGEKPKQKRRRRRVQDPDALINDLTDLRAGAPVVHEEHGIGRYLGLTNLEIDDTQTEFLTLEYAGGDRLHVPVSSLHLISRYTGAAPGQAPLHRLGTDQWARTRKKAAEKIRDAAAELLDLYAQRAARTGQSAQLDLKEYEAFAAGFPFTTTDDQAKAIEDVLEDICSITPMDRLVCGDVGFGKTEVALRAAFVAASNSWQVAMLVPTTLLAQQHYQTFSDRFADWPINVEMLSRFRSEGKSRAIIESLGNGSVDIVIGTHRLLQRNVKFKNLGLVIIDEEHRFGVRHKEQLKALRTEVDILTLTATPIPRTLNMSLGGLRELSLITTPPETRLSIKTFVTRWNDRVIREACLRELKRGGQVYFVHNRIEDIHKIAARLKTLVPESSIEVAHGQMRERELERIMMDFNHRRFHILVCTAIIESGLDIPTANTIIINRADRFGLAQLHQLRGRVGRSHHQAFAYLIAPPEEGLTADAKKRLDTIEALEDLGAGFVLATHDLEIRGAGELLGEGQSGQIQEIGFALYNEMLSRTVAALRDGREPDMDTDLKKGPEINLHLPALMPEDYLPDVHLRLVHYKRIASAQNERELTNLQIELIDRFGLLPEATRNLFRLTEIRLKAAPIGIRRLDMSTEGGLVEFSKDTNVDPTLLVRLIESEPERYRLDREQKLRIREDLSKPERRFQFVNELVTRLAGQ